MLRNYFSERKGSEKENETKGKNKTERGKRRQGRCDAISRNSQVYSMLEHSVQTNEIGRMWAQIVRNLFADILKN
jgi:hypothetical protein